jgi:prephenate dehydrogenase
MTVQITIIGLGQIGSSIGLALKARGVTIRIVGHDKDTRVAKEAQKTGAVDDIKFNLPASVRDARIVVLALPFAGIKETLEVIAPDLQDGALVLDTAPSKATVAAWAKEILPQGRYYVGLTPAINPEYLHGTDLGISAAHADLFKTGMIVVDAPMGTPENAFNLAMDFVTLIGAVPLLMDTAETDGIFAAMHLLPQLAAAALLDTTVEKPGWQEARKLGGRPYASVTAGLAYHDEVASLGASALENRENVVRLLNSLITSLIHFRDAIDENDREALSRQLEHAARGRERWLHERLNAEWLKGEAPHVDIPSFSNRLLGSLLTERGKLRK